MREWKIRESVKPSYNMILECDDEIIMIISKNDKKRIELIELIRDACNDKEKQIAFGRLMISRCCNCGHRNIDHEPDCIYTDYSAEQIVKCGCKEFIAPLISSPDLDSVS